MKKQQYTCVVLALFMVIVFGCVTASAATIEYLGPYYYSTSKGNVRVGHFEVAGKTAFCIQHEKGTPATGTSITTKIYDNDKIRRVLYYGYGGPEQWPGFTSAKQGIVFTSLLLSEVNPESSYKEGHYNFIKGMPTFRNYALKRTVPNTDLTFSSSSVKGYYSAELGTQRTPDITVQGSSAGSLTLKIPSGIKLRNNRTGATFTGSAGLQAGDSFFLIADGGTPETLTTMIAGSNIKFQPIVYKTASSSVQDLGTLKALSDTARPVNLTVTWDNTGTMKVLKKAEDGKVGGIKFKFAGADGSVFYRTTGSDGSIELGQMTVGKYTVSEEDVDTRYVAPSSKVVEVERGKTTTITFTNELKRIDLKIKKVDSNSGKSVNGARFKVEDVTGSSAGVRALAASGNSRTYSADRNGEVKISDRMIAGRTYRITEVSPPNGYMLNNAEQTLTVDGSEDEKLVIFKNEGQYVIFDITKTGNKYIVERGHITEKEVPLQGVEFEVTAAEDIIDPGSSSVKFKKGATVTKLKTDEKGKAATSGLPEGKYSVREVKTLPGYKLEREVKTYDMTVPDDKKEMRKSITVSNERYDTEFRIYKLDKANERKLAGASFVISDEDGETIEVRTDKSGSAGIKNLPPGTYTYRETKAPDGYIIDKEEKEFTIDADDPTCREVAVSSYNIRDEKGPVTGDRNRAIFAFVFVSAVALLIILKRYDRLKS